MAAEAGVLLDWVEEACALEASTLTDCLQLVSCVGHAEFVSPITFVSMIETLP